MSTCEPERDVSRRPRDRWCGFGRRRHPYLDQALDVSLLADVAWRVVALVFALPRSGLALVGTLIASGRIPSDPVRSPPDASG